MFPYLRTEGFLTSVSPIAETSDVGKRFGVDQKIKPEIWPFTRCRQPPRRVLLTRLFDKTASTDGGSHEAFVEGGMDIDHLGEFTHIVFQPHHR